MDTVEEYAYICIACHEPLLSSTDNQWIRVGRRHLMPRTGSSTREQNQLLLEDESVLGKQELALCELQRLQCGSCKSQVGLKCKNAPIPKKRLIGRLFVRQDALKVHGLAFSRGSGSSPHTRVVQHVQFAVENQPYLAFPAESSASPVAESTSRLSDPPAPQQIVPVEQIHALLKNHARLIAEVKALRQVAATNQHFLRTQLNQVSNTKSPASEQQATESMVIDSHNEALNRIGSPSMVEARDDTQLPALPIDSGIMRYSDSEYEPTQPLMDQPLHQPVTRKLASGAGYRTGSMGVSSNLRRNTLEDLQKSRDATRNAADPNRRGGTLRRGFSGGRGRAVSNVSQRQQQDPHAAPSRDENGNLITSTGKIDGRSLRYKNKRVAEYQSSPLAAARPMNGTTLFDSTTPARNDGAANNELASAATFGARTASSTLFDGQARSHQEIMKYVNKGMTAQMAKSRLERGYSRLPKPT